MVEVHMVSECKNVLTWEGIERRLLLVFEIQCLKGSEMNVSKNKKGREER